MPRYVLSLLVGLMCAPPVAAGAQPNAAPPSDLVDQVLKDLEPKSMVRITEGLAESVVARAVDLDSDGRPEWLTVVQHALWCGRHGAYCPLAVYAKDGNGFRRLFPARVDDVQAPTLLGVAGLAGLGVGPHRTAGFLDLAWHFDSGEDDPAAPYDVVLTSDGSVYTYTVTKRNRAPR